VTDLKDQETIKEQILIAEKELAALDAKRAALQKRIEQLRGQRQSVGDERLPFDRLSEPIVTNESTQEQKIALFQSFFRGRDDIVAKYGYLIVDECHHISARSFEIVARQCKAKYVTGLSATVTRKDGHHPIIFMNCGPVRYKVDDRKQALERPFAHKVIVRETNFRMPESFEAYQYTAIHEIYKTLLQSNEHNQIIASDVMRAIKNNRFPVVLTERVERLKILKSLLENEITNLIVMKGGMGKKKRQAALNALQSLPDDAEKAVLATGRYLGEGFDDDRLDTLFLTLPISWRGTLNQYAGRLHRIHDSKKEVVIYDYADLNVPVLARMYDRRLKGYRSIGYGIEDDES